MSNAFEHVKILKLMLVKTARDNLQGNEVRQHGLLDNRK